MISQAEIFEFAALKSQADKLDEQIKAIREALLARVQSAEETEGGEYALKVTSFDKTTTKYKEVLVGLKPELNEDQVIVLTSLLASNSTTKTQHNLEAVIATEEVVVVKKTRKLKVA